MKISSLSLFLNLGPCWRYDYSQCFCVSQDDRWYRDRYYEDRERDYYYRYYRDRYYEDRSIHHLERFYQKASWYVSVLRSRSEE